jgi:hypothetical protein
MKNTRIQGDIRFRSKVHSYKRSYVSVEVPTKSFLSQPTTKIKVEILTMKSSTRMGNTNLPGQST